MGWKQETAMDMGGQRMLSMAKENRKVTVTTTTDGKLTTVMLMAHHD